MPMLDEQRERARAMVRHPGGDLSARAATCLSVVLGALEDAERLAAEMHVTMRRMADERDAARAELEAARAVVEAAEKRRAAQAACDAEAERPAPSRSSAPMVRLIGCDRRLYEALDAYDAAKAGKAVE